MAPNVVEIERSLGVDPSDFRLWVCLHECTHRLQFTAVPWLGEHMRAEVGALVDALELDPKVLRDRAVAGGARTGAGRPRRRQAGDGLLAIVQGPASQAVLDASPPS